MSPAEWSLPEALAVMVGGFTFLTVLAGLTSWCERRWQRGARNR